MNAASRTYALETALGAELPPDYREFLVSHRAEQLDQVVSINPEYWGVSRVFELGDGVEDGQVDRLFDLVGDVLPSGTLPVAEDQAGNFYLLDVLAKPGTVYWWNHERELGDQRMEKVTATFSDFIGLLEPSSS